MEKSEVVKAALYLRVTSEEVQAKEFSLEAQEKACRDFCAMQGIEVSEGHIYLDIASGSSDFRPGLSAMLKAFETSYVDTVVVYKLDRLTRNTKFLLNLLNDLSENGIGLRSVTEPFDTQAGGGVIVYMLGTLAAMERDMSHRLRNHRCQQV